MQRFSRQLKGPHRGVLVRGGQGQYKPEPVKIDVTSGSREGGKRIEVMNVSPSEVKSVKKPLRRNLISEIEQSRTGEKSPVLAAKSKESTKEWVRKGFSQSDKQEEGSHESRPDLRMKKAEQGNKEETVGRVKEYCLLSLTLLFP